MGVKRSMWFYNSSPWHHCQALKSSFRHLSHVGNLGSCGDGGHLVWPPSRRVADFILSWNSLCLAEWSARSPTPQQHTVGYVLGLAIQGYINTI